MKDGTVGDLDGLDPILTWSAESKAGGIELEYGIECKTRPAAEIAKLPRTIWGKAKRKNVKGWEVSAGAKADCQNRDSANLEFDVGNSALNMYAFLLAKASKGGFDVKSVEATKGIKVGARGKKKKVDSGARVSGTVRYNVKDKSRDVAVDYVNDVSSARVTSSGKVQWVDVNHKTGNTDIRVVASRDKQAVTISQQVDDTNRVSPTVNNKGDVSVEWERRIGDEASLSAILKHKESLDVEYEDAAWTVNVNMPIAKSRIRGATVSMKRDVFF